MSAKSDRTATIESRDTGYTRDGGANGVGLRCDCSGVCTGKRGKRLESKVLLHSCRWTALANGGPLDKVWGGGWCFTLP